MVPPRRECWFIAPRRTTFPVLNRYEVAPIACANSARRSGSVTGSEQRSPTHTNAAPSGAAAILSRAGCAAGSASAFGARSTMRVESGSRSAAPVSACGALAGTRHHDLGRAQAQIERVEHRGVADQVFAGRAEHALDQPVGLLAPGMVAGEGREADQVLRRDPVRVGRRVVAGGARAHHQALGVVGGEEIAAVVRIGVVAVERALPGERLVEVAALGRRLVQRQRGADHVGEVGGEAGEQEPPFAPGMAQPVAAGHLARQ